MKPPTELSIELYLVKRVHEYGGIAEKYTSPGRRGVPDRIVLWPKGYVDFVEMKTATGKLTSLQRIDHSIRRQLGHAVFVLRTKADVDTYVNVGRLSYMGTRLLFDQLQS